MTTVVNSQIEFLKNSKVLITGGAGYIGSHLVKRLLQSETSIDVIDNLETGFALPFQSKNLRFFKLDLKNFESVKKHFENNSYQFIFHLAGSLNVAESVAKPLYYFENNIQSLLHLLKVLPKNQSTQFIFSSTSSVYSSEPPYKPFNENSMIRPLNPYGESKLICESILRNYSKENSNFSALALRFFNVAGASDDGRIGQKTLKPYHIVHRSALAALNKIEKLTVFGHDFPTSDGTCVRDYLHVEDLIEALILAAHYLSSDQKTTQRWTVLNCGYEIETSVLQVIQTMQKVTGQYFDFQFGPRRAGDPAYLVASNQQIKQLLGWQPRRNELAQICHSAYVWEKSQIFSASSQAWTN